MPNRSASAVATELGCVKTTVIRAAEKHGIGKRQTDLSGRVFWSFTDRDVDRLRSVIQPRK